MKALLALRSVGFFVGQRQMCLNVRWAFFSFIVFMQQKFHCHCVVVFFFGLLVTLEGLLQMGIKSTHLSPTTKVSRKQKRLKFHRQPHLQQGYVTRSPAICLWSVKSEVALHCQGEFESQSMSELPVICKIYFTSQPANS